MNNFPNSKQRPGSHTCGPSNLENIYCRLGIDIKLEEILNEIGVDSMTDTHVPQLGSHLISKGVETKILSSCTYNMAPEMWGKSREVMIEYLEKWTKEELTGPLGEIWEKDSEYLLDYLKNGGEVGLVDMTTKIFDDYLSKGYLILTCLESSWIWGERKIPNEEVFDPVKGRYIGHFVTVYGQEGDDYLVSDPYPTGIENREGLYKISKNKLLVATLIWGAQALVIKINN